MSNWLFSVIKGVTINEDEVELIPDKREIIFPPDMHAAIEKEVLNF